MARRLRTSRVSETQVAAPADDKLAPSVMLGCVLGSTGFTASVAAVGFFQLFFLTDVAKIPAAMAGTALLLAKLWDTANDPMLGWISDKVAHRFPPQRWLKAVALPLAVTTALLWWVPDGLSPTLKVIWVVLIFSAFDTLFTMAQLSFNALTADLAGGYDTRTRVMTVAGIGAVLGYLVGSVVIRVAVGATGSAAAGHAIGGALLGALAGVGTMTGAMALRQVPSPRTPSSLQGAWTLLTNRPLLILMVANGLTRAGFTVIATTLAYYAKYYLGAEECLPYLILLLMVVIGAATPFWRRQAADLGKAKAYAVSLLVLAPALAATWWIASGAWVSLIMLISVLAFALGGHWVLPWAILPDTIDWHQARHGSRPTGLIYGVFGLADKLARTFAVAGVGWSLDAAGYMPGVALSPDATMAIRLLFGPIPAVLVIGAVPLLWRFPIDRHAHAALQREIIAGAEGVST